MPIARARQNPPRQIIHIRRQIGVGFRDFPLLRPPAHRRAILQSERVKRYMLRRKRRQPGNRILPLRQSLMRQPIHQIQIDVAEPGIPGGAERIDGLGGAVAAAQQPQQPVVQTLHADAQAVDALPQQPAASGGAQVAGVGLDGHLGAGVNGESIGRRLKHGGDVALGQVRRGAAAEKHGSRRRPAQHPPPQPQLAGRRLDVVAHLRLDALVSVEIAIGAFRLAERRMDVQPQPGRRNHRAPGSGAGAIRHQ